MHFAIDLARAAQRLQVDDGFRHQRAGGARLHALAAGHAGRHAHRIVEIEHGLGIEAPKGHADHVVHLNLAAGAHAKPAFDASVEIDRHGGMRQVRLDLAVGREARMGDLLRLGPMPERRDAIGRILV